MRATLLCLHGWGASKEAFEPLRAHLRDTDLRIVAPDLPGFGDEQEPEQPYTLEDYVAWTEEFIARNMQGPFLLLGHSHGGRIAIMIAAKNAESRHPPPIRHLFLCAPAGIRHTRHIKRIIGLTLAKTGRFFLSIPGLKTLQPLGKKFLYQLIRVHDYEKASPVMRQTLINVTAEDLLPLLKKITIPTDIFWGAEDGMTPFSDARIMEKEIRGSTLHTYEGTRHSVHRDRAKEIAEVVKKKFSEREGL